MNLINKRSFSCAVDPRASLVAKRNRSYVKRKAVHDMVSRKKAVDRGNSWTRLWSGRSKPTLPRTDTLIDRTWTMSTTVPAGQKNFWSPKKLFPQVSSSGLQKVKEAPHGGETFEGVEAYVWERDTNQLQSSKELNNFYIMGDVLGQGTYGTVYKCECKEDRKEYAVKVIKKSATGRFRQEVILSARVNHPAISSPLRVFESPDEVFIVTEYCRGGELFEFVADHNLYLGTLNEAAVLEVTREMLVALEACHKAGFAHLDVKPENFVFRIPWSEILRDISLIRGNLVLIDFGTAQPFLLRKYAQTTAEYDKDMDEFFSGDTALGGTASYVSPEVLFGRFSSRSDLWSLGVTLFMLIAGRRPFDANFDSRPSVFDLEVQMNVKKEAALPLGESLYSTCEELGLANTSTVDLLLNMMHPEPIQRRSATELIQEIDRLLAEEH